MQDINTNIRSQRLDLPRSMRGRRRWTLEAKQKILTECEQKGESVYTVAPRYNLSPSAIFKWRRLFAKGALTLVKDRQRTSALTIAR